MHTRHRIATVAAAVFVLSGCGDEDDPTVAAEPTPAVTATAPANPGAVPTPAAASSTAAPANQGSASLPPLTGLVISGAGVGGLRLGDAISIGESLGLVRADPDTCEEYGLESADTVIWPTTYPAVPLTYSPDKAVPPLLIGVTDNVIDALSVWAQGPRTAAGIGVGSTLAELQAAYPDGLVQTDAGLRTDAGDGSAVWRVTDGASEIFFEVGNPGDDYYPANGIWLITIRPTGKGDGASIANTDSLVGGC